MSLFRCQECDKFLDSRDGEMADLGPGASEFLCVECAERLALIDDNQEPRLMRIQAWRESYQ